MGPVLLREVLAEMREALLGAVVSRVHQPDERTVLLRLFARGKEARLVICAGCIPARMHLTAGRYPNPPAPPRFCAFLRKWITDARIEAIEQPGAERIVHLELSRRGEEGMVRLRLVCELTGKSGNIILVDADGVVLDSLRHFPPESSMRAVFPGLRLEALPPKEASIVEEPVERSAGESWNEAADRHYSSLVDEQEFTALKAGLGRAIAAARKKLERKLANLEGDRARSLASCELQKTGELLKASFHTLKKGMKEAEVLDYAKDPPEPVRVALDERLGARENIERIFKKARKARKALELLAGRIPAVREELDYIDSLRYDWEEAAGVEGLAELRDEMVKERYMSGVEGKAVKAREKAEPVRRFTSSEGFEILCGKSGTGNDLLVSSYASGDDLWLHAKGLPGSHALIKAAGRGAELTKKSIIEAASIAAFYSKARAASKVEVIYTEARNVRKPRGAKPGMVTVKEYRSVMVRPALPVAEEDDGQKG